MANRGKSERSRREQRREEKPVILIICEGETEELYFADVKRRLRANWIEVRNPHRCDPKGLVSAARRERRALTKKGLRVEPWVVFDAESSEVQDSRGYEEAIAHALKENIGVANSSPCFEYWVLLHYAPGIMVGEPKDAERELKKPGRIPGFKKPDLPHDALWTAYLSGEPSQAARSRREAIVSNGEKPRLGRPVTYVDALVDKLASIGGMQ